MKIYIAGSYQERDYFRFAHYALIHQGFDIVSEWYFSELDESQLTPEQAQQTWKNNICDMLLADALLVDASVGTPRATFAEAGYWLATKDAPLHYVTGGSPPPIFALDFRVRCYQKLQDFFAAVEEK